jgi:hypothetical protein
MPRTVQKWARVYINGYDMSGQARAIGPLGVEHEWGEYTAFSDGIKNGMLGKTTFSAGELDVVLDTTATSGSHILLSAPPAISDIMVAIGMGAAPAVGNPAFLIQSEQLSYHAVTDDVIVTANAGFSPTSNQADTIAYNKAWGQFLHSNVAVTAPNSANGGANGGAATTAGGYMMYQVLAGNGTATISIDDSANDSTWLALSGATTGAINCAVVSSGIIALATTATVRQYLRWQIALGTANTVTFVLAFVRG